MRAWRWTGVSKPLDSERPFLELGEVAIPRDFTASSAR
jgi:hypothetical protein